MRVGRKFLNKLNYNFSGNTNEPHQKEVCHTQPGSLPPAENSMTRKRNNRQISITSSNAPQTMSLAEVFIGLGTADKLPSGKG